MQPSSARSKAHQKLALLVLGAIALGWLVIWLVSTRSARPPVSVTFLGCTNVDSRGIWQPFTMAHFRLTNLWNATLVCGHGVVEFQIGDTWVSDTNRLDSQYGGSTLQPHGTLLVAVSVPPQASRLRTSFRITRTLELNQLRIHHRLDQLLDSLGVQWRPGPATPILVPCEVAIE